MVKNSESPRISFYVKKKKNYYTCGLWTIENIAQRPGRSDLSNASLFKIPTFFFFLAFLLLFFLFFVLLLHQEMKKSEDVVAEARRRARAGAPRRSPARAAPSSPCARRSADSTTPRARATAAGACEALVLLIFGFIFFCCKEPRSQIIIHQLSFVFGSLQDPLALRQKALVFPAIRNPGVIRV
jgi:hypothetical protein